MEIEPQPGKREVDKCPLCNEEKLRADFLCVTCLRDNDEGLDVDGMETMPLGQRRLTRRPGRADDEYNGEYSE